MRHCLTASVLAFMVATTGAFAQVIPANPPRPAPGAAQPDTLELTGTLANWNYGPRGAVEGILVKTADGLVQINLPPEASQKVAAAAALGDTLAATVAVEPPPPLDPNGGAPDHAVYRGLKVVVKGTTIELGGPGGPDQGEAVHIDTTVKSLNFDRRGAVNGAILESGELLTLGGPGGMQQLTLKPGDKLSVDGTKITAPSGIKVVEPATINGKAVQAGGPRGGPPGGPGGPGPGGPGGPRGGPGAGRAMGGPEGPVDAGARTVDPNAPVQAPRN
jgi:hypothetical protein